VLLSGPGERLGRFLLGSQLIQPNYKKGFSLVELLIAVAIVGVLSTTGVPNFRRLVFKAKKTEGQFLLGSLSIAQSFFFMEYNAYGNNLRKMGISFDGARYYIGGFNNVNGAVCTALTTLNIVPKATTVPRIPLFYESDASPSSFVGLPIGTRQICQLSSVYFVNNGSSPRTYTAFASANLISSDSAATCFTGGASSCDVWRITPGTSLQNVTDGIPASGSF
jgi:prepilin-type N-terminal cleavage/methylation domain-containing protein